MMISGDRTTTDKSIGNTNTDADSDDADAISRETMMNSVTHPMHACAPGLSHWVE